jgi:hypothetical protein
MSDERVLRTVIDGVTEFVREKKSIVGAEIGGYLHREFPDFLISRTAFRSLTEMLERVAPELSIVGRSGSDYIWSTDATLDELDANLESAKERADAGPTGALLLNCFSARNFKSLAHVDVPLRAFNILVGANGAGKTSVLEGLFLLSQLRYKKPATIFKGPRALGRLATLGLEGPTRLRIEVDSDPVQSIEYVGTQRADQPDTHVLHIRNGGEKYTHDFTYPSTGQAPRQLPLLRTFGGSTLLRLDARKLAAPSISTRESPTLRHDGRGLPSVLSNFASVDPERRDEIVDATRRIIPALAQVRMPRRRVPRADGSDEIGDSLELKLHGKWLDASLASEGTLLVLGLMTIVYGLRSTRLLLVDDIERALHPKAQRTLVEHLMKMTAGEAGLQIVCTTHSPYLLDAVDPEDVLVVRAAPDTGLSCCRRLVDHEKWAKWRASMTPGEFWSYVGEDWLEGA